METERTRSGYVEVLGAHHAKEGPRLRLIGELCDPDTIDHIRRLGIRAGWRCLEVGAGAGSIARWLSDAVGPAGSVIATDLDIGFMADLRAPNLQVLRHDVANDPRPGGPFDLIHCRFVLEHVRGRDEVVRRLASWLAPGGWLLVEAALPLPDMTVDPLLARCYRRVLVDLMRDRVGSDLTWAGALPRPLSAAGLADVDAVGLARPVRGRTAQADASRLTLERLREVILAEGLLAEDEIEAAIRTLDDPGLTHFMGIIVAAWGRRPEPGAAGR